MIWSDDPRFWDDYIAWGKGRTQLAPFEIHYEFGEQSQWKRSLIHFGDTLLDGRIKYHRPPRQKYLEYATRLCEQRPAQNEYWAIVVEVTAEG